MAVMMAALMFVMVPRAAASAERIQQVLDSEAELCDPDEPSNCRTRMAWSSLTMSSLATPGAEEPVLCDISFTARPGQTTAIVGSTGAGKTTLINLIPRFYDVTSGHVRIDGVDVREMRQEDLWRLMGVVPQKAYLFSGTVAATFATATRTPPTTNYGRPWT